MKLFEDDFIRIDGQNYPSPSWPPPEFVLHNGKKYQRIRYSEITDEERETMTHVCRGGEYEVMKNDRENDERIARRFHEVYEKLASQFNYRTRTDTNKPWEEVPANNKQLMIAVVHELIEEGTIS